MWLINAWRHKRRSNRKTAEQFHSDHMCFSLCVSVCACEKKKKPNMSQLLVMIDAIIYTQLVFDLSLEIISTATNFHMFYLIQLDRYDSFSSLVIPYIWFVRPLNGTRRTSVHFRNETAPCLTHLPLVSLSFSLTSTEWFINNELARYSYGWMLLFSRSYCCSI